MRKLKSLVCELKIWNDSRGQDLVEYALMAGFVAVAAGAAMPNLGHSLSQMFSMVGSAFCQIDGS